MRPTRIPLFPLDLVLFPGMKLPLHIFEPRYKLMVRRCLDSRQEFGVILARTEGIASVGCTAAVLRVVRNYPDGRMDILTRGEKPYEVIEVVDEKPHLEATVRYLEESATAAPPDAQPRLLQLYDQCHSLLYGRSPSRPELRPGFSLAYHIAGDLPLELEQKQELIELRAEGERQSHLLELLDDWLPQLEHRKRVQAKAGGNGHGLE